MFPWPPPAYLMVAPWAEMFFSQHTGAENFFLGVYGANISFYNSYNCNFRTTEPGFFFFLAGLGPVFFFGGGLHPRPGIFFQKKSQPPPAYLMVAPLYETERMLPSGPVFSCSTSKTYAASSRMIS